MVIDAEKTSGGGVPKTLRAPVKLLQRCKSSPVNSRNSSRSKRWSRDGSMNILEINDNPLPVVNEDEEAIGIITMEDVIEELLQVTHIPFYSELFILSGIAC